MLRRAALALALCASPAAAQTFYAGKTLSILVNYDAGGPTDIEARVLARHLGKHIPGNPDIIVRNMGGAAGLVGAKWLGEVAARDGLTAGYLTAATQRYVANPEKFNVDFRTYEFITIVPSGRIHFMRSDVKPGRPAWTVSGRAGSAWVRADRLRRPCGVDSRAAVSGGVWPLATVCSPRSRCHLLRLPPRSRPKIGRAHV